MTHFIEANPDISFINPENKYALENSMKINQIQNQRAYLLWKFFTEANYYFENDISFLNRRLRMLYEPELYNAYADVLIQQTNVPLEIHQFFGAFQKELRVNNQQIISSVLAYWFQKNRKLVLQVKMKLLKWKEEICGHSDEKVCQREYCKYYLNPGQFREYQMLYGTIQESSQNEPLKEEFLKIVRSEYPDLNNYVERYVSLATEKTFADVLLTPFLYGWIKSYYRKTENSRINEVLTVLYYLIMNCSCQFLGAEITVLFQLFYTMYADPSLFSCQKNIKQIRKRIEKAIHSEIKGNIYETMTFFDALNIIIMSSEFDAVRQDSLLIYDELKKCRQAETDRLLSDYYLFLYLETMLQENKEKKEIEEFDSKFISSITCFLSYWETAGQNPDSMSVKVERKIGKNIEIWKGFLLYAQKWLNVRYWSQEENQKTVKKIADNNGTSLSLQAETLSMENQKLKNELEELRQQAANAKTESRNIKALYSTVAALQKEKAYLTKQLEDAARDRSELIGLRNYIYEESSEEDIEIATMEIPIMAKCLNEKVKGVIVGGHPKKK